MDSSRVTAGRSGRRGDGERHVHPDRSDAQSGDLEVPARPGGAGNAARSTCATRDEAAQSPLAERLFAIPGVSGVFFGSDFIAVTKNDAANGSSSSR